MPKRYVSFLVLFYDPRPIRLLPRLDSVALAHQRDDFLHALVVILRHVFSSSCVYFAAISEYALHITMK